MHFSASFLLALIPAVSHACVTDAVMRSLSAYRYSASDFCTLYLRSTISETIVVATTVTTTDFTVQPPPITVTATITKVETLTVQVDSTTTTALYPSPIKRAELDARSVPVPPYLSTFAPYQLSSGCSCFITPLPTPTYTVVASTVITTYKHATTTLPPLHITKYTTTTSTSTITQTLTTVVPNCFPVNGCIMSNTSWSAVAWNLTQDGPLWCQYYCGDIGGCLSFQVGLGAVCNIIALEGWRAWDASPAATGVAAGVGGPVTVAGTEQNCSNFWIYERECGFITGYPEL
ncbi:hypothetical protein N431DRAFT_489351 [Stipitochalara longipes BDJ]|nr:hypothetical protein N431DRAFT_489351 [Stipitochalara longipes BDJ]